MKLQGLTQNQAIVLDLIAQSELTNAFYFTGGTALATAYLHHRKSEDLDFFSETEVDLSSITTQFSAWKKTIGFKSIDIQTSFNRNLLFLHFPTEVLKLEFTYYPFPPIEQGPLYQKLPIDSIRDIAINKLFTIAQKPRSRDYIDLFFILQKEKYEMRELYFAAKLKFDWHIDPIQLGSRFVDFDPSDTSMLLQSIPPEIIQTFFIEQAQAFKKDIFKA